MNAHLAKADQSRLGSNWSAGDIMYADINGDGVVDRGQGTAGDPGDLKIIGNSTPRFNFGLNLTAEWRGLDLKRIPSGNSQEGLLAGRRGPVLGSLGHRQMAGSRTEAASGLFSRRRFKPSRAES